jgi:thiol-disulfide isomerase/thioredoxin
MSYYLWVPDNETCLLFSYYIFFHSTLYLGVSGNLSVPYVKKDMSEAATTHNMVLIHAHWCGYCKMMIGEWQRFTREAKSLSDARVIAIESAELGKKLPPGLTDKVTAGLRGFPLIQYYNSKTKKLVVYSGERTAAAFMSFLQKQMGGAQGGAKKRPVRAAAQPVKKPPVAAAKKPAAAPKKKKTVKGGFVRSGSTFAQSFYANS